MANCNNSTSFSTFLSPLVKEIYDSSLQHSSEVLQLKQSNNEHNFSTKYLKKWNLTVLQSVSVEGGYLSKEWYLECIRRLASMLKDPTWLLPFTNPTHFSWHWTKRQHDIHQAISRLNEDSVAQHYLSLLQISALMEAILRCIFLLKGTDPPFLLRDLVDTSEIKELLGAPLVEFLKVTIGSVHGLNIRNLAWHGFLGVQDIHREHAALIFLACHNCGEEIMKKGLEIDLQSPTSYKEEFSSIENYANRFEVNEDPLNIIRNSSLVHRIQLPLWEELVSLIANREHGSILLLFPLLENALRTLYTVVNNCPTRILSATNSEFYITMDEILSPWLTTPKMTEHSSTESKRNCHLGGLFNLVPQYLGYQLTVAFLDVFHYISGPRLRDKLSHGEVLPEEVPFVVVIHVFRLTLLALSTERWRFCSDQSSNFTIKCSCELMKPTDPINECSSHYPSETEELLRNSSDFPEVSSSESLNLVSYILSYECLFHSSSQLKKSLIAILCNIKEWKQWRSIPAGDISHFSWEDEVSIAQNVEDMHWAFRAEKYNVKELTDIDDMLLLLTSLNPSSLYASKLELEFIKILQGILNCLHNSVKNIKLNLVEKSNQYSSKTLHSRQRNSYEKQLKIIPILVIHIFLSIQVVYFVYSFLPSLRHIAPLLSSPLKALTKKLLKASENLCSRTQLNVNNYPDAVKVMEVSTGHINNFFVDCKQHKNIE